MKTNDFFYSLPAELIAQTPAEPRDASRLLVYDRKTREISDKHFFDVSDYFNKDDVIILNNTRVLPVRLHGQKAETLGKIEFLLLKRLDLTHWEVLARPARIAKVGTFFNFGGGEMSAEVLEIGEEGKRTVKFSFEGVFEDTLRKIGEMPLPHYIKQKLDLPERYNTVYSRVDGSAAAPTAGLHFTTELLQKLKAKGVIFCEVLLHVGLGTFRPVKTENIENHTMHSEFFSINQETADTINSARKRGSKVVAVGTTTVRVLESVANPDGTVKAGSGETSIFLYPPHEIKTVDALVTNFHLPESTLLMLISCLCGREEILRIYNYAVSQKYRFFSLGDAMLIK